MAHKRDNNHKFFKLKYLFDFSSVFTKETIVKFKGMFYFFLLRNCLIFAFLGISQPHQFIFMRKPGHNPEHQIQFGHRKYSSQGEAWLGSLNNPTFMTNIFKKDPLKLVPEVLGVLDPAVMDQLGLWEETNVLAFERHVLPECNEVQKLWWQQVLAKENLEQHFDLDPNANLRVSDFMKVHIILLHSH